MKQTQITRNNEGVAILNITTTSRKNERLSVLVDDDDYIKYFQFRWSINPDGYVVDSYNTKLHILILNNLQQKDNNKVIDHVNGNKLDCRKINLRFVSRSFNSRNKDMKNRKSSIYRGVVWSKWANKWMTGITIDGKRHHLGYFGNEEDASIEYENKYKLLEKQETTS